MDLFTTGRHKFFDILGKMLDEYLTPAFLREFDHIFRTHHVFGWSEVDVVG